MGDIIVFKPPGLDCEHNLDAYVSAARALPFFPVHGIVWNDEVWDLRGLAKPTRSSARATVVFAGGRLDSPPLTGRMGDFARAFVAFGIAKSPGAMPQVGKFTKPVIMMRRLAAVMAERGLMDPANVTPEMLDAVIQRMKASLAKPNSVQQNAMALRWVADELNRIRLLRAPFQWSPGRNAGVRQSRIVKTGGKRMLSQDELEVLAEAFNRARTPREQIVSSVAALLCCAPMRISEVLRLPVDCEVLLDPGDGYQAGLRWWPLKGGRAHVKFVPKAMIPVAQKAIERLRLHTEPARQAARAVLEGRRSFSVMPPGWPDLPADGKLAYDRALMVVHPFTLAESTDVDTTTIEPITYAQIAEALRGNKKPGKTESDEDEDDDEDDTTSERSSTIFDSMGIRLRDGSRPRINTHKPRHYLNTIANRASVPEADIALWAGRKSIHQNSVYDHETAEEFVARIRARSGSAPLPTIPIENRADFDIAQIKETAHTTEYGWCLQSLRQNPCEMFGACLDCYHLVCIKGATGKLANIRRALATERALRARAQARIDEGLRALPRWMELFDNRIDRLEHLVEILESNATVDGSPVVMSDVAALPRFDVIEPGKLRIASAPAVALNSTRTKS